MPTLKCITGRDLQSLSAEAAVSPRRRKNLNLHPVLEDSIQRLFNAMEPGTYVRPHRHARPEGWELMLVVKGEFAILRFDDHGIVTERVELGAPGGPLAVEIPAYAWHTVVALAPGTCLFEVKPGPYSPVDDKDFADWAPGEGETKAADFTAWYLRAAPGDGPPPRR